MKTKYTQILKVKDNILQKAQAELELASSRLTEQKKSIEKTIQRQKNQTEPESGSMAMFEQNTLVRQTFMLDLARKEKILRELQTVVFQKQALYRRANIDYEKFKYLNAQEEKAIKDKKTLEEAKFLDEMGGRGFFAKKRKNK